MKISDYPPKTPWSHKPLLLVTTFPFGSLMNVRPRCSPGVPWAATWAQVLCSAEAISCFNGKLSGTFFGDPPQTSHRGPERAAVHPANGCNLSREARPSQLRPRVGFRYCSMAWVYNRTYRTRGNVWWVLVTVQVERV